MPKFRRSPVRGRPKKNKNEDGSFNFTSDDNPNNISVSTNTNPNNISNTTISTSNVNNGTANTNTRLNRSTHSINSSHYTDSDDDISEPDDTSHKRSSRRRFFRSSPTKIKRKSRKGYSNSASMSLHNRERTSPTRKSLLDLGPGNSARKLNERVMDEKFTPFANVRYSFDDGTGTGTNNDNNNVNLQHPYHQNYNHNHNRNQSISSFPSETSGSEFDSYSGMSSAASNNGDDDESLKSLNSLKIGQLNKMKRAQYIKQHLKSLKAKYKRNKKRQGLGEQEDQDEDQDQKPEFSIANSPSMGKSILPSRIESHIQSSMSFSNINASTSTSMEYVDNPWEPNISLDPADQEGSFHFPSDPFAEFDAHHAVAVNVEKEQATPTQGAFTKIYGFTPKQSESEDDGHGDEGKEKDENNVEKEKATIKVTDKINRNNNSNSNSSSSNPIISNIPPPPLDGISDSDKSSDRALPSSSPMLGRPKPKSRITNTDTYANAYTPEKTARKLKHPLPLPPAPPAGPVSPLLDRPLRKIAIATDSPSISSTIGDHSNDQGPISPSKDLPLIHIAEYMKLNDEERLQAYCDLFGVAAETIKDVDEKRAEIVEMGHRVDGLVKRVGDMEREKMNVTRQKVDQQKELVRLKGLLDAKGGRAGGTEGESQVDKLKSELESKDIIIEALQRSLDEWKNQEEVDQIRSDLAQDHDKALEGYKSKLAKQEKTIEEQSELIRQQKTIIYEARQEIQDKNRNILELRADVSSRDQSIIELQQSLSSRGRVVVRGDHHAELEKSRETVKALKAELERERSNPAQRSIQSPAWSPYSPQCPSPEVALIESPSREDEILTSISEDPSDASATQQAAVSGRSLDVNIPIGTVKARIAMAASRAMKNSNSPSVSVNSSANATSPSKDSLVKRSLATFNGSAIPSVVASRWRPALENKREVSNEEFEKVLSQLREKDAIIEGLRNEFKIKVSKLVAEKKECEHYMDELKATHEVQVGKLSGEKIEYEHRLHLLQESHRKEMNRLSREKMEIEDQLREVKDRLEGFKGVDVEREELNTLRAEKHSLEQQVSALTHQIKSTKKSATSKVTKEDENKFADIEDGYREEIKGLLREKKECQECVTKLEAAHKDDVRQLEAEQETRARLIDELQRSHKREVDRLLDEKKEFESKISQLEQQLNEMNDNDDESSDHDPKTQVGETTCEVSEEAGGPNTKENQQLRSKIKNLEEEIETLGGLLEETISSIKEKDDEIEALKDNATGGRGVLGRFSGQGAKPVEKKMNTSQYVYTDDEIKQLERICKLHQLTITRQRKQAKKMLEELKDAKAEAGKAEEYKEKVALLESQFVELNIAMEQNKLSSFSPGREASSSIVKVDAAHISSLESKTMELQNQIKLLKNKNETLNEKLKFDSVLREQVDELSLALEARELEIKELEKAFKSRKSARRESVSMLSGNYSGAESEFSEDEDLSVDELKEIISKRDKMIKKLKGRVANLEQSLKTVGPRGAVINLRKVSLMQEMQDAIIRRLNVLISRMDDNRESEDEDIDEEFMSPSKSFLISMSDKLSLLHDYQKISLHLLELRLNNEIESLRSGNKPVEMSKDIDARFERTLETLKKTEKETNSHLIGFGTELKNHETKLSAKNTVIRNLQLKERDSRRSIESLQAELRVFKGLGEFKNVNSGVLASFRKCDKLEKELEEKEMVIQRLNNVIEDYRNQ